MDTQKVFAMPFSKVYPAYLAKAEKKGRTKAEIDKVLCWLTGYTQRQLSAQVKKAVGLKAFIDEAPKPSPNRTLITGVVCGVRVEDVKDPTMREIRYMDKLIDELAKGKAMEKICRA